MAPPPPPPPPVAAALKVTVWLDVVLADLYWVPAVMDASTAHAPAAVVLTSPVLLTVQPDPVTEYDTVPAVDPAVPPPRVGIICTAVPTVPVVGLPDSEIVCDARKVTVWDDDVAAAYVESAAMVAVTTHAPAVDAFTDDPDTVQVAEPEPASAYVTAPDPDVPDATNVTAVPTVPDVGLVDNEIDWELRTDACSRAPAM